jgi:hypothetical protein
LASDDDYDAFDVLPVALAAALPPPVSIERST